VVDVCDYATGARQDRLEMRGINEPMWLDLSPDGRLVLGNDLVDNPLLELLNAHVLQGALGELGGAQPVLWATGPGRLRHFLPMTFDPGMGSSTGHAWSAEGKLLALASGDTLAVWDIPPRKPLSWVAAGATLFSLPPFVIARWRVRRLRREAAA